MIGKVNLKNKLVFLILILLVAISFSNIKILATGADVTAPVVNSVYINKTQVTKGGSVTVSFDITENGTGCTSVNISLYTYKDGQLYSISSVNALTEAKYTGDFDIIIDIPDNSSSGEYFIGQIDVMDGAGNSRQYWNGWSEMGYDIDTQGAYVPDVNVPSIKCYITDGNTVNVISEEEDDEAPEINNIILNDRVVNKGDVITLTMEYEECSEIESVNVSLYGYKNNQTIFPSVDSTSYTVDDTQIVYTIKLSETTPSGEYFIGQIDVMDGVGNSRQYWNGWLETGYSNDIKGAYIPDFYDSSVRCYVEDGAVVSINSTGDINSPIVSSISLDKTEVKKPGVISLTVSVVDDTEISSVDVCLYAIVDGDVKVLSANKSNICQKEADVVLDVLVPTTTVCSTYYIGQIDVMDTSGNSRQYWNGWSEVGYDIDTQGAYISDIYDASIKCYIEDSALVEVKEEFDVAFEMALSNPELLNAVNNINDGETGKVLIDGDNIAEKELFEAIKGCDKTILFYKENYQWIVNGKDVKQPKDVDLNIQFSLVDGTAYGKQGSGLHIEFADNGELPCVAKIRIKSDYTYTIFNASGNIGLYYINEKTDNLDYIDDSDIKYVLDGTDHWCWFNITHNSSYIAVDRGGDNTSGPTVPSEASISTSGIYVAKIDRTGVTAGVVTEGNKEYAEYSWWACKDGTESWFLIQDWTLGSEWLNWTPDEFGDYIIVGKVRLYNKPETESSTGLNISYHPQIKGKCQMPYTGEGGGYLIGVESYENPNQSYQYEMLVLDCTLLLEGKDAWVYTTGKFSVTEGNAGWTVWQPQYGYYWTLFRVYDAEGNLLDQYCYSFANAY